MFYLTPQEKKVIAGFLTIFLLGSCFSFGLHQDLKPLRWVKTSSQKIIHPPPNINTASIESLDKLPGIGPKTAANIVAYREAHGPFLILEDLRKVKGITKKNWEKIANFYNEKAIHE